MYNYRDEFLKAFQSTKEIGFHCSPPILSNQLFFNELNIKQLTDLVPGVMKYFIDRGLIEFTLANVENQDRTIHARMPQDPSNPYYYYLTFFNNCLDFHIRLLFLIEQFLEGCQPYLTIGYVHEQVLNDDLYRFDSLMFSGWLKKKNIDFFKLNFHVWITLETLEIIDATHLTTLGFDLNREDLLGRIYHHPPEFIVQQDKRQYHPVVVGTKEVIEALQEAIL